MKYSVYLQCNNGNYGLLLLRGDNNRDIVRKVRQILQDNEGGCATVEDLFGFFFTTVEA